MGFPLVVLAKFHLLATSCFSHGTPTLLAGMVVPFSLRAISSITVIRHTYYDLIYSIRLFVFQLTQIALNDDQDDDDNNSNRSRVAVASGIGTSTRWDRALRLVSQGVSRTRRRMELMNREDHEDAFHELSMITL